MNWLQQLSDTYDHCEKVNSEISLLPISHVSKQAHIEIVLDSNGNFRRAFIIKEATIIPATDSSAGRTAGEAPHPLCDKVQYCAGDYQGTKKNFFKSYLAQLTTWCESKYGHNKAKVVLKYVSKNVVVRDLIKAGILVTHDKKLELSEKPKGVQITDYGDAFIRWRIETPGDLTTGTWEDVSLFKAWSDFDLSIRQTVDLCLVTGNEDFVTDNNPKGIRHSADGAKLISSNDETNYTFRGRFTEASQAATIGFRSTQKAHNALRWLIARQAFRTGDQVFVAWSVNGEAPPSILKSTLDAFMNGEIIDDIIDGSEAVDDIGQAYAIRLRKYISGYNVQLKRCANIMIIGLDSASPGRMSVIYYRELQTSEFLERLEAWHSRYAWRQNIWNKEFIGVPSPRDIANAAYGTKIEGKSGEVLLKATIARLLPCIIDSHPIPRDIVESCINRSINRIGIDWYVWNSIIRITCGLYKGLNPEKNYQMTIEENRTDRDYLYGRLLAVADHLENRALYIAGEKRETTAARLLQRFANRPFDTWMTISMALAPYKSRLRCKRGAFLTYMEVLIADIMSRFDNGEFENNSKLSGAFLLGFNLQMQELRRKKESIEADDDVIEA